jgi:hypothetical protein
VAVDAVSASSSRRMGVGAWWLRLIVRTIIALIALWAIAFAADRYDVFFVDFHRQLRMDAWLWLSWIGAAAGAGLLFGFAACLPFARVRYAWSRLLLAAVALVPIAQFWWVFIYQLQRHGKAEGWLIRADWLMDPQSQFALAALAGVAIASGFRAKGSGSAAG